MRVRKNKTVAVLVLIAIVCCCLVNNNTAISDTDASQIDIYTNKEPYAGRGQNSRSDAFAPGEEVTIHAFVSSHGYGIANILVAFRIQGPPSQIPRIVLYRTALTDETGIATIGFRVPYEVERSFGDWSVLGSAKIAETSLSDSLAFEVGWIVEIESLKTVDENGTDQLKFPRDSRIGIVLIMKSIAMSEKSATVTLTIHDSLARLVDSAEVENIAVQPSEIPTSVQVHLLIPATASLGEATVYACCYTSPLSQGGTPYSPEVTARFFIAIREVTILTVRKSTNLAYEGETVYIDVTVQNKGTEVESFELTAYSNDSLIATEVVSMLEPLSQVVVQFKWNTTGISSGLYYIGILANVLPNGGSSSGKPYSAGFVEVRSRFHDIAVALVKTNSSVARVGEILAIQMTIRNNGHYVESFNITARYDSKPIETLYLGNFQPNSERTLTVHWNTSDVPEGKYVITAFAEGVQSDIDPANNVRTGGTVELTNTLVGWPNPNLSNLFWPLIIILVPSLLLILRAVRRKRRKPRDDFEGGWTAWYYGYSRKSRTQKNQCT